MLKQLLHVGFLGLAVTLLLLVVPSQAQAQQWAVFTPTQVESVLPHANWVHQHTPGAILAFHPQTGTCVFIPNFFQILRLPPYVGQYRVQGNIVYFKVAQSIQNGTGSVITMQASGEVEGQLDLRTMRLVMDWQSGVISVGGTLGAFYSHAGNGAYRVTATTQFQGWQ